MTRRRTEGRHMETERESIGRFFGPPESPRSRREEREPRTRIVRYKDMFEVTVDRTTSDEEAMDIALRAQEWRRVGPISRRDLKVSG